MFLQLTWICYPNATSVWCVEFTEHTYFPLDKTLTLQVQNKLPKKVNFSFNLLKNLEECCEQHVYR